MSSVQKSNSRVLQAEQTRNRVYQSAIDEYQRVGVDQAQIESIVKRAGCSVGTFYRYFPSRSDILFERRRRNSQAAIQRFQMHPTKARTLKSLLHRWLGAVVVDVSDADFALDRQVLTLMTADPERQMHWLSQTVAEEIAEKIQAGQDNGLYRSDFLAIDLAKNFNTGLFGFLCNNSNDTASLKKQLSLHIELFISGISV